MDDDDDDDDMEAPALAVPNAPENVDENDNSFSDFVQEMQISWEKIKSRADVAEVLLQATSELKKLRNGTATQAISAFKCFNRNLSYQNLYVRNSRSIGIGAAAISHKKKW